jgi:hypothetical protein
MSDSSSEFQDCAELDLSGLTAAQLDTTYSAVLNNGINAISDDLNALHFFPFFYPTGEYTAAQLMAQPEQQSTCLTRK